MFVLQQLLVLIGSLEFPLHFDWLKKDSFYLFSSGLRYSIIYIKKKKKKKEGKHNKSRKQLVDANSFVRKCLRSLCTVKLKNITIFTMSDPPKVKHEDHMLDSC